MKKKKSLLVKVAMTLLFAVLSSAGAWASEVVTAYQKNRPLIQLSRITKSSPYNKEPSL